MAIIARITRKYKCFFKKNFDFFCVCRDFSRLRGKKTVRGRENGGIFYDKMAYFY